MTHRQMTQKVAELNANLSTVEEKLLRSKLLKGPIRNGRV